MLRKQHEGQDSLILGVSVALITPNASLGSNHAVTSAVVKFMLAPYSHVDSRDSHVDLVTLTLILAKFIMQHVDKS